MKAFAQFLAIGVFLLIAAPVRSHDGPVAPVAPGSPPRVADSSALGSAFEVIVKRGANEATVFVLDAETNRPVRGAKVVLRVNDKPEGDVVIPEAAASYPGEYIHAGKLPDSFTISVTDGSRSDVLVLRGPEKPLPEVASVSNPTTVSPWGHRTAVAVIVVLALGIGWLLRKPAGDTEVAA